MKQEHIEILSCRFGKSVTMAYFNKVDSQNYDVENSDNVPHPDLKKAVTALHKEMAGAFYVLGPEKDNFAPNGFTITKAGGEETIDQVDISGKLTSAYKDTVTIKSGDIPINTGELDNKITKLRMELWEFFFNEKYAVSQGSLEGMPTKKDAAKQADK